MSKILININNLEEMEDYREIGITNFLFAISSFSIGYKSFSLEEIPDNVYLLVNRLFDTYAIAEFKKIIPELKRFRGIVFEDVGLFNLLKDTGLELIWFQNHFGTNYESINFWLDAGCKSAVISNELTEEEIKEILAKTTKPLVLNILGKNQIMYSRRTLLSNFNKYNNIEDIKEANLVEPKTNNCFLAKESEYGTVIMNAEYFNYVSLKEKIDDTKIYYYLVLNQDLRPREIKEILNGKSFGNTGFLNKKTVYRMSEYDDR